MPPASSTYAGVMAGRRWNAPLEVLAATGEEERRDLRRLAALLRGFTREGA